MKTPENIFTDYILTQHGDRKMTEQEKEIIKNAMKTADAFGISYIRAAKNALELEGFNNWSDEYEKFIFNQLFGQEKLGVENKNTPELS